MRGNISARISVVKGYVMQVRRADRSDAAGINAVKSLAWSEEPGINAAVIELPEHRTFVAVEDGIIVGFVDGFLTTHWELDLLAVHPDYRGHGIARQLIKASDEAGQQMGANLTRALIQMENHAMMRALHSQGYRTDRQQQALYIQPTRGNSSVMTTSQAGLIVVQTLTYNGIWIECPITDTVLTRAKAESPGIVGVVLNDPAQIAQLHEFQYVNRYQWWYKAL